MSKDDGGPAFPNKFTPYTRCAIPTTTCYPGMTLLDWFAGKALSGLRAGSMWNSTSAHVTRIAYDDAEAMVAEKRRRESHHPSTGLGAGEDTKKGEADAE